MAALALAVTPAGHASGGRPDRFSVSSGRVLRDRSEAVEAMERVRELRMRVVQDDSLIAGRRHERLDQYYRGVRVFGGEVVRETDGKTVLGVTGTIYGPMRVDTTPALEPEDALAVFGRETGSAVEARSELVVLPKDDGTFVLAYRVTGFVRQRLPVLFVNAQTGVVELRYDNLRTQQPSAGIGQGVYGDEKKVSGTLQGTVYQAWDQMRPTTIVTYDLRGNVARMLSRLTLAASDIATSPTPTWTDGVVVDAHTYLGWTYDYFFKRHAWKGFDNRDSRAVHAVVHPVRREDMTKYSWNDVGMYYANASFCAQCGSGREDIVMFGEGLPSGYSLVETGQYVNYYAASLDIVAHEYSHGVIAYTSDLIYRNEAGALDEAFADIMATGAEFFLQPAGSGRLKADYLHGEETYVQGRPGSVAGSRSLADPGAFGDPDHYSKLYTGDEDNGGVHTNSSVANHAFYLAVEGGTNRTSGLEVHGVGAANREQIERVFFRAFTTLPSDATFSQARAKTVQSARDLFTPGSAVERAVTEAWTAVGVQ
jgi:thermolysin